MLERNQAPKQQQKRTNRFSANNLGKKGKFIVFVFSLSLSPLFLSFFLTLCIFSADRSKIKLKTSGPFPSPPFVSLCPLSSPLPSFPSLAPICLSEHLHCIVQTYFRFLLILSRVLLLFLFSSSSSSKRGRKGSSSFPSPGLPAITSFRAQAENEI